MLSPFLSVSDPPGAHLDQQAELNRADWLQTGVYSIILRGWDDWLQVQCQKESITWIKLLVQQAELNRADWLQTGV